MATSWPCAPCPSRIAMSRTLQRAVQRANPRRRTQTQQLLCCSLMVRPGCPPQVRRYQLLPFQHTPSRCWPTGQLLGRPAGSRTGHHASLPSRCLCVHSATRAGGCGMVSTTYIRLCRTSACCDNDDVEYWDELQKKGFVQPPTWYSPALALSTHPVPVTLAAIIARTQVHLGV
jgi:hypothetical protein